MVEDSEHLKAVAIDRLRLYFPHFFNVDYMLLSRYLLRFFLDVTAL